MQHAILDKMLTVTSLLYLTDHRAVHVELTASAEQMMTQMGKGHDELDSTLFHVEGSE